jgi:undecaprenyl-diphosphatase
MILRAVQPVRDRPLISDYWRRVAIGLTVLSAVGLAVLCVAFYHDRRPTAFDSSVRQHLYAHSGHGLARVMLSVTDPRFTTAACVGIAVLALVFRRWNVAAVTIIAPIVAIVLTTVVLKPLIARRLSFEVGPTWVTIPGYAFPSGHETGLTSLTAECALLVLRAPISAVKRGVAMALLVVWTVTGALGLVRNAYHYASDTIGGVCVSLTCVLGAALLVDAIEARRRRAAG